MRGLLFLFLQNSVIWYKRLCFAEKVFGCVLELLIRQKALATRQKCVEVCARVLFMCLMCAAATTTTTTTATPPPTTTTTPTPTATAAAATATATATRVTITRFLSKHSSRRETSRSAGQGTLLLFALLLTRGDAKWCKYTLCKWGWVAIHISMLFDFSLLWFFVMVRVVVVHVWYDVGCFVFCGVCMLLCF